jgi:hypothetical protein
VWEVGGLQGTGEDLDGVVLGCDFGERFWAAVWLMLDYASYDARVRKTHYFSTHGCKRLVSCLLEGVLEELA